MFSNNLVCSHLIPKFSNNSDFYTAATDQCDAGCGVVRRTVRAHLPARGGKSAGQRLHGCRFQRLLIGHGGQDAGETRRQHRLAGAGRPHQQDIVANKT